MKWIPVNYEKPESGIGVIIYLMSGFITIGYRKKDEDGYAWQLFGDTEFIVDENDEVTHWMMLPNSPHLNESNKLLSKYLNKH